MTSPLSRAEVEARLLQVIAPALAHYVPGAPADAADELTRDLAAECMGFVALGFELGIRASHTPQLGALVLADITGAASGPNTRLAPGVTRQRASAAINRVRGWLGLPPRCPHLAR